jgi:uncharacterized protein with PQ loop repeat
LFHTAAILSSKVEALPELGTYPFCKRCYVSLEPAVSLIEYAPIAAAAFAIPQFIPQISRLLRSGDVTGVSWTWAGLTSMSNAGWFTYFLLSGYSTALVPAASASVFAGILALVLGRCGRASARAAIGVALWAGLLGVSLVVGGLTGLGTMLTGAFVLQVTPSIWTAYRTKHPTGISRGTWLLVCGELSCWIVYGISHADPRLVTLGITGVTAGMLMLARTVRPMVVEPPS